MATKYTGSNEGVEGLRVRDQDGNPNVSPVTEIRVTDGTLTDDGNGVVSIQTGGGGGGGSAIGPAGSVQLSDGAGNFVADSEIIFDTVNDRLLIGDSATGTVATAVPGATTVVDSWPTASFRSGRYSIQITDSITSEYQISDLLLLQDGTNTTFNEFGVLFSGASPLGVFSSNVLTGNARLIFTPANPNAMNIKIVRTLLEV